MKQKLNKSKVTIGLPVYNGEKFISETIDSILAQNYKDFTLIISDNASTDRTEKICRSYAAKDKRVVYHRNKMNIGAARNYNQVFNLSSSEYFRWNAYDDLLTPDYLMKCVEVLDENPSIVLCHSKVAYVDEKSKFISEKRYAIKPRYDSKNLHERFGDLIYHNYRMGVHSGLVRSKILKKTSLMGNYIGSDRNLLAEISLYGQIHVVPKYLFHFRLHEDSYSTSFYSERKKRFEEQLAWWNPNRKQKNELIIFHNCLQYFLAIKNTRLKTWEKILCYNQVFKWIFYEGGKYLLYELSNELIRRSNVAKKILYSLKKTT